MKVIDLLKSFSATDWRRLEKRLPNQPAELLALLLALKPLAPDFENVLPEAIFKQVLPDTPYENKRWRYLCSDLSNEIELYFVFQVQEQRTIDRSLMLLRALRERRLNKQYQSEWQNLSEALEKYPYRDERYFQWTHDAAVEYDAFLSSQINRTETNKNLLSIIKQLDHYYFQLKLRYACAAFNRKNVLAEEFHPPLVDELIAHVESTPYPDNPAIAIFYQIYKTLDNPDEIENYQTLKQRLNEGTHQFAKPLLQEMYAFALNYCIGRLNRGETEFLKELFELYQHLLDNDILLENGFLTQWNYKNIVTVGLRLGEFDWVEKFINGYVQKLKPSDRDNAQTYNRANLYFFRKEYGKSLRLLQEVKFTDVFYHLDSKSLLMKIYYEIDDQEALLAHIQTFKVFLQRDKLISDYQRKVYSNLISFVMKLVKIKQGSSMTIEKVAAAIEAEKTIADLTWLKKKVEELS